MNLFIESIEGGTYLVALENGSQRAVVMDNTSKPLVFHCLNEIRAHFANESFGKVTLKQATPYEEMCGMDAGSEPLEMEIDW
ncbi:DUF6482 family protein [Alteromonas flava]|uniref:DUF6482 family protein n=1 Tax=Alteromonas flava TaxID=2048003 RepID=UPI000C288D93|nr:DUF6482 family protein [Alteromonas flava]